MSEKLEAIHARMTRLVDEAHRLGGVENAAKAKAEAVAKANDPALTNGSVPTEKRRLNSGAAKRAATQAAKEAIQQAVDAVYGTSILTTAETAAVALEPQAAKKPSNVDLARAAIARQPERITNIEIRQANPGIPKELILGAIYTLENAKEIQKVDRGTWQALPTLKSVPDSIYQHLS